MVHLFGQSSGPHPWDDISWQRVNGSCTYCFVVEQLGEFLAHSLCMCLSSPTVRLIVDMCQYSSQHLLRTPHQVLIRYNRSITNKNINHSVPLHSSISTTESNCFITKSVPHTTPLTQHYCVLNTIITSCHFLQICISPEVLTASIKTSVLWDIMPIKHWQPFARIQSITSQKTVIFTVITKGTWYLSDYVLLITLQPTAQLCFLNTVSNQSFICAYAPSQKISGEVHAPFIRNS